MGSEQYLFVVIILAATLLQVECIRGGSPTATETNVQIAIIGAGPSGIAAASKLLENGVDNFIILEAQFHYGGRVNTVKFGNEFVDLGAEWVHGEKGNLVFDMAMPNGLIAKEVYKRLYIEPSGKIIAENEANELTDILDEIEESAYGSLMNYTGSIGDYFNEEYPKKLEKSSLKDSPVSGEIKDWFAKDLNVDDSADSWYETSGRGYAVYELLEGHQEWGWISGGYNNVLHLLMKKLPDPKKDLHVEDKIHRNCQVELIKWDDVIEEIVNKVIVKCSDGAAFIADYALVTVSLGVLKEKAKRLFKPSLPPQKINSIEGLGFGTVDKIILEFPNKWWPHDNPEYALVWEPNDECKTRILTKQTADLDDCWDHFVYAFNNMPNQPNVLCGWVYGAAARYMEQLPVEQVTSKVTQLLQKFLGSAFNVTVPEPTNVLRTTWYTDPFFRGSYSFRSMETEKRNAEHSHLAEPVLNKNGKPVLLFAGEATHSTHYSTVHGAIETGWREAERILKYIGSSD